MLDKKSRQKKIGRFMPLLLPLLQLLLLPLLQLLLLPLLQLLLLPWPQVFYRLPYLPYHLLHFHHRSPSLHHQVPRRPRRLCHVITLQPIQRGNSFGQIEKSGHSSTRKNRRRRFPHRR